MPMIKTTTNSSIKVKPFSFFSPFKRIYDSSKILSNLTIRPDPEVIVKNNSSFFFSPDEETTKKGKKSFI